jgi:hypothetical protein
MRRHSNDHLAHLNAKPFTDFSAECQVMEVADLNVASMRGTGHERTTRLGTKELELSAGRHKTSFQYFHS